MWFLYLLSWLSFLIQICFVTLSIAAGLFYLAEIVEEYTVMTGRIIRYLILGSTVIYVGLLLFETLPISLIVMGLITNIVYFAVLKTFPFIELSSPIFIASIVLICINHYMAFSYFSQVWHPFSEVLAFFTLCLWVVPFTFFVSLSANENVLPTTMSEPQKSPGSAGPVRSHEVPLTAYDGGDIVSNYFKRKSKRYGLLTFFKYAQESILPQRVKKGY